MWPWCYAKTWIARLGFGRARPLPHGRGSDPKSCSVNETIGAPAVTEGFSGAREFCDRNWLAYNRDLVHHFDAKALQRHNLARMIGQQADGVQTQVGENLRSQTVFVL